MRKNTLVWVTSAIGFLLISEIRINLSPDSNDHWWKINEKADARSSGGRSGGGSFRGSSRSSNSTPSRSNSTTKTNTQQTTPSYNQPPQRSSYPPPVPRSNYPVILPDSPSYNRPYNSQPSTNQPPPQFYYPPPVPRSNYPVILYGAPSYNRPYNSTPTTTPIASPTSLPFCVTQSPTSVSSPTSSPNGNSPKPSPSINCIPSPLPSAQAEGKKSSSSMTNTSDQSKELMYWGLVGAGGAGVLGYSMYYHKKNKAKNDKGGINVTKLQVALLAEARQIQRQLTELSLSADTSTDEGLSELLKESALALLRSPENWTHCLGNSQQFKGLESAETAFDYWLMEERSKLSAETLTNLRGQVTQGEIITNPDEDPAAYIVVTFLIGSENEQPLFGEIRDEAGLKAALTRLSIVPPESLLRFELIWSPQDESDSLTYDELLTEYTGLIQIS
ncbi:MAG: hypothetical protein RLZZ338_2879 [Cyanobacteriota bacterium]